MVRQAHGIVFGSASLHGSKAFWSACFDSPANIPPVAILYSGSPLSEAWACLVSGCFGSGAAIDMN